MSEETTVAAVTPVPDTPALEYQAIFDNAAIGIAYTRNRVFGRCNQRAASMFGLTPEEMVGLPGRAIYPSDESYAEMGRQASPALAAGQAFEAEWQYMRRDGTLFWCHVFAQAVDKAHTDQGTVWILADVTEARELRLKHSQALEELQAIMDNASVAIIFTRERKVFRYNPRFCELFGFPAQSLIGMPGRALYRSDEEYAEVGRLAGPLLSQGLPFQHELFVRHADGRDMWINLIGYLLDPGNPQRGTIWLIEDRSAFKQAENALQQSIVELREINHKLEEAQNQLLQSEKLASIGQLAAGVAHEINNPVGFVSSNMHSLLGYSEKLLTLLDAYEAALATTVLADAPRAALDAARQAADIDFLREDMMELLRESSDGLRRVSQIVQDLKDFSHVDAGVWKPVDLNACFESTLNVVRNEIKYKARIERELASLPEVCCNAPQINQVMMNLLVNAAHAIETKGTITLRSGSAGEWAWFEVQDTGKGIAPEHMKRIFEPFFTTKPVGKGTGLGLSVSYGIVNKHGGRIEVDSQPGAGARFRVWLPIHGSAEAAAA